MLAKKIYVFEEEENLISSKHDFDLNNIFLSVC